MAAACSAVMLEMDKKSLAIRTEDSATIYFLIFSSNPNKKTLLSLRIPRERFCFISACIQCLRSNGKRTYVDVCTGMAFLEQLLHKGGFGRKLISLTRTDVRPSVQYENAAKCYGRAKRCEKTNFNYHKAEVFQLMGMLHWVTSSLKTGTHPVVRTKQSCFDDCPLPFTFQSLHSPACLHCPS